MARKSAKTTKPPPPRKAAGKPRHPDHKDEATTEDFAGRAWGSPRRSRYPAGLGNFPAPGVDHQQFNISPRTAH